MRHGMLYWRCTVPERSHLERYSKYCELRVLILSSSWMRKHERTSCMLQSGWHRNKDIYRQVLQEVSHEYAGRANAQPDPTGNFRGHCAEERSTDREADARDCQGHLDQFGDTSAWHQGTVARWTSRPCAVDCGERMIRGDRI